MRFKLYPGIRERDVHKTPTPRLGGIAMFIGIMGALLVSKANEYFGTFWADPPKEVIAIAAATTLIVIVGVADDLWDLDWMIKLGAQFLAAGIIAGYGELEIYSLPIGGLTVGSSWVSFTLTVFAIVVVMNAVNFIDGLDGLVAGVTLIANGVFFVYSYLLLREFATSNFSLATFLAAALVGACLGFLPLNWSPAKLFMGDAGALMIGLLMATSAVAITGALDPGALDPEDIGRSQLLGAFIPILSPSSWSCCPCSTSGSPSSVASARGSRRSLPIASTCTTACLTWATATGMPCSSSTPGRPSWGSPCS